MGLLDKFPEYELYSNSSRKLVRSLITLQVPLPLQDRIFGEMRWRKNGILRKNSTACLPSPVLPGQGLELLSTQ